MRAPIVPALLLACAALGTVPARATTAGEARTKSFKLQTEGMRLYKEGKFKEATEAFQQVVKAEAQYRQALEINVAFADSYTHLGDLYLRRGRLDDAIDLFLKAIAVRPDFGTAYTRLGIAYARLHLYNDAIAATRRSQELS